MPGLEGIKRDIQSFQNFASQTVSKISGGKLGGSSVGVPPSVGTGAEKTSETTQNGLIARPPGLSTDKPIVAKKDTDSPSGVRKNMKSVAKAVKKFFVGLKEKYQSRVIDRQLTADNVAKDKAPEASKEVKDLAAKWKTGRADFIVSLSKVPQGQFDGVKEGLLSEIGLSPQLASALSEAKNGPTEDTLKSVLSNIIDASIKEIPAGESGEEKVKILSDIKNELQTMENPEKLGSLLQDASLTQIDSVVSHVMDLAKTPETQASIITGALKQEVENHTDPGNLLRGASFATKGQSEFSKRHIAPHLASSESFVSTLRDGLRCTDNKEGPVQSLVSEVAKDSSKEIGPDNKKKTVTPENQEKTKTLVKALYSEADKITKTNTPAMNAFSKMCTDVKVSIDKKWPDGNHGSIVTGNFLFLRTVCPAIIAPQNAGIELEFDRTQRGNATLVSKVIQNQANGIEFGGKEEHMTVFNDFLTEQQPIFEGIRDSVFQTQ